jgi:hypothetical protein
MDTEKPTESTEIEVIEEVKYEVIDWNDQEARFYPATGAIMVFSEEHNRWIIRANRGGRPDFDGKEMVAARELKKEKAIVEGLEAAGYAMDLRSASGVLSAIVAARARNAVEDEGRTGNADAKFIFSLVSENRETGEEGPAVRIDMDEKSAKILMDRLLDL